MRKLWEHGLVLRLTMDKD